MRLQCRLRAAAQTIENSPRRHYFQYTLDLGDAQLDALKSACVRPRSVLQKMKDQFNATAAFGAAPDIVQQARNNLHGIVAMRRNRAFHRRNRHHNLL